MQTWKYSRKHLGWRNTIRVILSLWLGLFSGPHGITGGLFVDSDGKMSGWLQFRLISGRVLIFREEKPHSRGIAEAGPFL